MRFLALDQALQTTGYAVLDNSEVTAYGTFKTKNTDPIEKRLGTFWQELDKLYETYKFDHLFLEDVQKQTNVETYRKLCYIQATILLWCYWKENVPYEILSPSHWRAVLKDKYKVSFGRARAEQKKAAQELVKKICGVSVTQDEADALCIAMAGAAEYNKNRSAF